jgi:hypothetical protein
MNYLSTKEAASKWRISERTMIRYCEKNLVKGAFQVGGTWIIPEDAPRPEGAPKKEIKLSDSAKQIMYQMGKNNHYGIYEYLQVNLAYSSCRMASNRLTRKQVIDVYRTGKVSVSFEPMKIDDLAEIINHFEACRYMIETLMEPITTAYIRKLHRMLFYGTVADKSKELHIGEFRKRPDKLGVAHEKIADMLGTLIKEYEANKKVKVDDILHFHCMFEKIHPFEDGNGRVGRMLLLKECLRFSVVPYIYDDKHRGEYNRGIQEWETDPGPLMAVTEHAQERLLNQMDTCRLLEYCRPEEGRGSRKYPSNHRK